MQLRHDEIEQKARLLLEKAQRESFDLKNLQPCDEASHQPQQQLQQQQFASVDNAVTAAAESLASAGELL